MKKTIYSLILFTLISLPSFSQGVSAISWHQSSSEVLWGVNSVEANNTLAKSKKHAKPVIVALITDGVDTTNSRIKESLLRKDNAIVGWNFLGSKDGKIQVNSVGTESFRMFQKLHVKYLHTDPKSFTTEEQKKDYQTYLKLRAANGIDNYINFFQYIETINTGAMMLDSVILDQFGKRDILISDISQVNLEKVPQEYEIYFQAIAGECQKDLLRGMTTWTESFNKAHDEYLTACQRIESLGDANSNPRLKLGDDVNNFSDNNYGNADLTCGTFDNGTILSAIIAAKSIANDGYVGVSDNVSLMILRANPKGEAFDKDIYNALHFAIDGGAKVIVIPLVKTESQRSDDIEKALLYAKEKDVVVVMAAGDKSTNIDEKRVYPLAQNLDNVIRVGASTRNGMKAQFSNYGKKNVDIFAPGDDVFVVTEDNTLGNASGTDISASVVAGVVATLRSHYPKMTAAEIKSALISTARPMADTVVETRNGKKTFLAEDISVSGGVVDMKACIKKIK